MESLCDSMILPGHQTRVNHYTDPQPTQPNRGWPTSCPFPGGTRAALKQFSSRGENWNCRQGGHISFSQNDSFFHTGNCDVGIQVRTQRVPLGRCKLAQKDRMEPQLKQSGTKLLARKRKPAWMNMKPDTGEADKKGLSTTQARHHD